MHSWKFARKDCSVCPMEATSLDTITIVDLEFQEIIILEELLKYPNIGM